MLKAKTSAVAVATFLLSSLAAAQQSYVGIGAGQSDTDGTSDSRDTAYKLFAGYDFNRNWAVEGGWADLGKPTWQTRGERRETSWFLAGKGALPINDRFDLFAKLGAAWNKVDINDTRKSDLFAGVGAEYKFNKQVGLRLEYEDFGKFGDDNVGRHRANMWTIGVDFKLNPKF